MRTMVRMFFSPLVDKCIHLFLNRSEFFCYGKSPEYDVEWFRREHSKVEPQLSFISGLGNSEDMKKGATLEAIRRFAEAFGIDPTKLRLEKQKGLGRVLSSEDEIQAIQNEIKKIRSGESDPKMIGREKELKSYINDGRQFVSVLPSQTILIRKHAYIVCYPV